MTIQKWCFGRNMVTKWNYLQSWRHLQILISCLFKPVILLSRTNSQCCWECYLYPLPPASLPSTVWWASLHVVSVTMRHLLSETNFAYPAGPFSRRIWRVPASGISISGRISLVGWLCFKESLVGSALSSSGCPTLLEGALHTRAKARQSTFLF